MSDKERDLPVSISPAQHYREKDGGGGRGKKTQLIKQTGERQLSRLAGKEMLAKEYRLPAVKGMSSGTQCPSCQHS